MSNHINRKLTNVKGDAIDIRSDVEQEVIHIIIRMLMNLHESKKIRRLMTSYHFVPSFCDLTFSIGMTYLILIYFNSTMS